MLRISTANIYHPTLSMCQRLAKKYQKKEAPFVHTHIVLYLSLPQVFLLNDRLFVVLSFFYARFAESLTSTYPKKKQ